ncbi:hypothetical protein BVRB_022430, partial [Beta vulgaris subsp. vulgaris]
EIHCRHFRWKSSLVMHMLSDLIGEAPFRDIIRQLLEDNDAPGETSAMVIEAADGETPSAHQLAADKSSSGSARGISTKRLLKLCRHRSALNLDDFCDRWINGVRCPVLKVQSQFERKKSACKLRIEQVGVIMHGILKVLCILQLSFGFRSSTGFRFTFTKLTNKCTSMKVGWILMSNHSYFRATPKSEKIENASVLRLAKMETMKISPTGSLFLLLYPQSSTNSVLAKKK